jgi:hypothetical protein
VKEGVAANRATLAAAVLYLVFGAAILLPVLCVQVPCLGDYLNHLARIHILTTIDGSPSLQRFYERQWRLVPYFGMDLPVAAMAPVLGLYGAGRVFVALCVVMPVLAAASLQYVVRGRVGLMPVLAFLLSYNYLLARGFLNYLFSAGLAVMLFAGWIASAEWPRWRRLAIFALAAPLLYMSHVFAFVAYGLLMAGYEVARLARRPSGAAIADFCAAGAQAVPVLLLIFWLRAMGNFGAQSVTRYGSLAEKLGAFLSPLFFPGNALVVASCVLLPLTGVFLLRSARLPSALWPALLAVVLAACCMPHVLANLWGADMRLPLVAGIVLIGTAAPSPGVGPRAKAVVLAVAAVPVAMRAADGTMTLRRLDAQVAQVRQVVGALPAGARLLVVDADKAAPGRVAPAVMTEHIGLLAAIDRDAFVPFLFSGATALQLRPEAMRAASPNAMAISMNQLREGFTRQDPAEGPPPYGFGGTMYWLGWQAKFDYVLVTHFGSDMGALPPVLKKIAESNVADLYRIVGR